jgi:serine/threonine protein phosphatase 1
MGAGFAWRRMLRLVRRRFRPRRRASGLPPEIISTPWRLFPHSTTTKSHVFAIGDIHGCADLLGPLLSHLAAQSNEIGAARTIVFLGDLIDRGPGAIRSLQLAQSCDARFDRTVILPGNHEGALLKGLDKLDNQAAFQLWLDMGGDAVVEEIGAQHLTLAQQRDAVRRALPAGIEDRLRHSPGHHWDGNLLCVHAGISPVSDRAAFLAQGLHDATPGLGHWSTIREPFLSWRGGWDRGGALGPTFVVHGHTPVIKRNLASLDGIVARADLSESHARINLDLGSTRSRMIGALEALGTNYRIHVARRA